MKRGSQTLEVVMRTPHRKMSVCLVLPPFRSKLKAVKSFINTLENSGGSDNARGNSLWSVDLFDW